jgi:hypothetical protein
MVLSALLLVVAIVMTQRWWTERERGMDTAERREEAVGAARRLATDLTTFSYKRIDDDVRAVAANTTGTFATEYRAGTGADFRRRMVETEASSTGTVRSAGLVELVGQRAIVLLAVDQDSNNRLRPAVRVDRSRIKLTLVRRAGRWLIAEVEIV